MDNVIKWIEALGFKRDGDYCELEINNYTIVIDLHDEQINYPKLKEIGRNTTTNFSAEENFVVLDIIIGLLKQGYLPEQISIEKGYKLGHNTKSGNADVTVEDNNGDTFLIIEAKTYGAEFDKEWKNTLLDGGQLFSYERQENRAKALVLYASEVFEGKIKRIYRAITLMDNEDFLSTLENPRGYESAKGGNDKFKIWRDTYEYDFVTNGILEENVKTFEIEKVKTSTSDLKIISHEEVQKKYNQFATILRKHNIGGRENAFDKLVNLFLTKIVDEQQNQNNLQFNWQGVTHDNYFALVDRLQKLYQIGMEKFLNEKVSYVAEKDVEDAFRLRKDAAKDAVLRYFKELKYYSNNDFTFLDVYNEQLFYQNARVLVEIVQMLQDMKLRTEEQNQFLGDLFEGFLDSGVKQSEGQYFTPLPIVKFIISSLPLSKINSDTDIPKVIDYACGAGHFLNEYAEQLKSVVDKERLHNYYASIYGIEKEYRLSKVAKVSAFMYGQDDINIIYGDALSEHEKIEDNSFSVIVANPPYSVKGFLETLSDKERKRYDLSKFIDKIETNNSIELFFMERTTQLLKSEGVAAIIVPNSILSNRNLYEKARKMLLESFNIIAIVEFGAKTFGSTDTGTVTLFLEKKKYPPKESDNYKYIVERWFNSTDVQFSDEDMIRLYCDKMQFNYESYSEFQNGELNELLELDLFKDYVKEFSRSNIATKILKKKLKKNYTQEIKDAEYEKAQFSYIKNIEQEKVYYFLLAYSQDREVIVVKSPTNNTDMKKFLGYDWSKRKSNEGIKYLGVNINDEDMEISKNQAILNINTPLFDPKDLNNKNKINKVIKDNFLGIKEQIPEEISSYVSRMSLIEMLDFEQPTFDAQIRTRIELPIVIDSKFPLEKMSSERLGIQIIKGVTYSKADQVFEESSNQVLTADNITLEGKFVLKKIINVKSSLNLDTTKKLKKNDIFMAFSSGSKKHIGKVAFINEDTDYFAGGFMGIIRVNSHLLIPKYLYELLNTTMYKEILVNSSTGSNINNLSNSISRLKIPIPNIDIQTELLKQIEVLDKKYESSRMQIKDYQKQINKIFEDLDILRVGSL